MSPALFARLVVVESITSVRHVELLHRLSALEKAVARLESKQASATLALLAQGGADLEEARAWVAANLSTE